MPESVTLEEVLNLAKQLFPLERKRLIVQITPLLKRDLIVSPSQPRKSLRGIWKGIDIRALFKKGGFWVTNAAQIKPSFDFA
ncbi:MAG: hypothetical protein WBM44_15915 [Waterburya sp.]